MDFTQFLGEGGLYIATVLYAIGMFMKASKSINDKYIVFSLPLIGVIVYIMYGGLSINSAMQGILCSAVAVFVNQLIKQAND